VLSCGARYAGAYHHGVSTQQRAGAITATVGAAVLLVGTFLTWLRSGATERSSYDVFDLVDRLGFSEGGLVGWALRLWPLLPLLLVLTVIAWWFPASGSGWTATRAALTLVASLYAGAVAVAVVNAPDVALFSVGAGPIVTLVGAIVMLAGLGLSAFTATRRGPAARPSAPADDRS
jgi:hypothetical protein